MMMKLKNKKGFTLIELIVVIAILAILAAIAVPRIIGFQDTARAQANKQAAVQVRNAIGVAIANGEIKTSAATATYLRVIDTGAAATVNSGTATDFSKPSAATDALMMSAMSTIIQKYVGTFDLKDVNSVAQAVGVKITNTEVDVTVGPAATAPDAAAYDYSVDD